MNEIDKLSGEWNYSIGAESMFWERLKIAAELMAKNAEPTIENSQTAIEGVTEILKALKKEVSRRHKIEQKIARLEE